MSTGPRCGHTTHRGEGAARRGYFPLISPDTERVSEPCPEPAARDSGVPSDVPTHIGSETDVLPPPAPNDDVQIDPVLDVVIPKSVRVERDHNPDVMLESGKPTNIAPTDDVAPTYFDTLRGSITDPDVLAAAAKAEADRPAPTNDALDTER